MKKFFHYRVEHKFQIKTDLRNLLSGHILVEIEESGIVVHRVYENLPAITKKVGLRF